MLPRTLLILAAAMLLAACVDSDRLRSSLGGPEFVVPAGAVER
jgi:hypothetical protein